MTARLAIALAVPGAAAPVILRAADGAPEPSCDGPAPGLSLSHSERYAAAVVGPPGMALGVDFEPLDDPANAALCAAGEHDLAATLHIACKEAAFKAYREPYRGLRRYRVGRDGAGLTVRPGDRSRAALRAWPVSLPGAVAVIVTPHPWPPRMLTVRMP